MCTKLSLRANWDCRNVARQPVVPQAGSAMVDRIAIGLAIVRSHSVASVQISCRPGYPPCDLHLWCRSRTRHSESRRDRFRRGSGVDYLRRRGVHEGCSKVLPAFRSSPGKKVLLHVPHVSVQSREQILCSRGHGSVGRSLRSTRNEGRRIYGAIAHRTPRKAGERSGVPVIAV
jgi:hypothetical protein